MEKLTKELLDKYMNPDKLEQNNYIKVGMSSCGIAAGAQEVYNSIKSYIKEKKLNIKLQKTGCLGLCYAEPIIEMKIGEIPRKLCKNVSKDNVIGILEDILQNKECCEAFILKESSKQKKIVLRNCGKIDPENIEDYLAENGYQGFKKVLFELGAQKTIDEIKISGLRGRGGAGFPTWQKWNITRNVSSDNDKFVICNGDEGDPGAYMDRSVLEGDPHTVIEGMLIAGYCINASKGVFYIRAEYPMAVMRIQKAIDQCYRYGLLGENILGSGFNFDAEVRLGAGAFVCGEETALIASIEGKRGYPRPRPPFPAYQGLWNKPTVINNVETLANVPYIVLNGGNVYGSIGTEKSKGTKVFAITGKIKNSGLAEVPMGITLREIIYDIGGGVHNGEKLKAVQTGGPSGGLIPVEYLDTPVSYESLAELGSIMGSGGMIVMDESDCAVDVAKFFLKFSVDESCGKCAPCRIGSSQLYHILDKISEGHGELEDLEKLKTISVAMQKASLCGLGQNAPKPVLSALKYFEDEYIEHIKNKTCRSGKCLMKSAE